jgi:tRNA nucleotidyltransferase (CCA-adding enzyme)
VQNIQNLANAMSAEDAQKTMHNAQEFSKIRSLTTFVPANKQSAALKG